MLGIIRKDAVEAAAHRSYVAVVEQARQPAFYTECGVPDTPDGRFDLILLHAFLLFARMKRDREATSALSQAVFDLMFADMDQNLREMGVGDMGIGRRIKGMAEAFYGRVAAYEDGLSGGDADLADALARNLYRKTKPSRELVGRMTAYLRREHANLGEWPLSKVMEGEIEFGPPPVPPMGAEDER